MSTLALLPTTKFPVIEDPNDLLSATNRQKIITIKAARNGEQVLDEKNVFKIQIDLLCQSKFWKLNLQDLFNCHTDKSVDQFLEEGIPMLKVDVETFTILLKCFEAHRNDPPLEVNAKTGKEIEKEKSLDFCEFDRNLMESLKITQLNPAKPHQKIGDPNLPLIIKLINVSTIV